jgi:hypothetical protein
MGFFTTRERYFKPGRPRLAFLVLAAVAFCVTECGRYVYRPYVREHGVSDFGLADSIGNLGGVVVQIFLGLAVLNATRKQSYRLAAFFAVGYVLYEFAQPYLPKGVFDWKDIYGTLIGFMVSVLIIAVVWRVIGTGESEGADEGVQPGPITWQESRPGRAIRRVRGRRRGGRAPAHPRSARSRRP